MQNAKSKYTFVSFPNFCSDCGSILPLLEDRGDITCYRCSQHYDYRDVGSGQIKYTIHFNSIDACAKNLKEENRKESEEDGPIVERKCPKCGNDKMSYATIQLRSADEGQTVFYTCTKCKYKENENS